MLRRNGQWTEESGQYPAFSVVRCPLSIYSPFTMKKIIPLFFVSLLFAACIDKTGLSAESSRPAAGNPDAGVTVLEFADLQCPACRAANELVKKPLLQQQGNRIRFVFKHFPLQQIHRHALEAAEAAECAADQGKFWEFVDMTFERQDQLSSKAIRDWGEELGLDSDTFDRCIRSHIKRPFVLSEYDEGSKGGVRGTPTFFVNGQQVESTVEALTNAINKAASGEGVKL